MINNSLISVFPIFNIFFCLFFGLLIFAKKRHHPANISFALGMLSLSFIEVGNAIILVLPPSLDEIVGLKVGFIGQLLLVPSWLMFSVVFARIQYKILLKQWLPSIISVFIISIFFVSLIVWGFFFQGTISSPKIIDDRFGVFCYLFLIGGMILSLVQLEKTLRSSKCEIRNQIKYVVLGVGSIILFYIHYNSQALLLYPINPSLTAMMSVVTFLSLLVLAQSFVRNRSFNFGIVLNRNTTLNSAILLTVSTYFIYVATIWGANYFKISKNDFFIIYLLIFAVFLLLMLFFSSSMRSKILLLFNRYFYKHKYEFRDKWLECSDKFRCNSIKDVCDTISSMISETMGCTAVSIWLYDKRLKQFHNCDATGNYKYSVIDEDEPFIHKMRVVSNPYFINECHDSEELDGLLINFGAILCMPLSDKHNLMGFALLSVDISGEPYRDDDILLLKGISILATLNIVNVNLTNDLLLKKQETNPEFDFLFSYDVLNLTNSLLYLLEKSKQNLDKTLLLENLVEEIKDINSKLEKKWKCAMTENSDEMI